MKKIEGRNPVYELLRGNREVEEIIIQKGIHGQIIDSIKNQAKSRNIPLKFVSPSHIQNIAETHAPQGVVARCQPLPLYEVEEILQSKSRTESPFVVMLDQIQDPHNFGAIIRTAYAAGVDGILFPRHHSAPLSPVVAKAAAGAVEHVKLARITNINYTIEKLKKKGFWIAGTVVNGKSIYYETDLTGPLGIVIGNEGRGLRRLVRENCDFLVEIPMKGKLGSLNASVAAGIIIFEAVRQRSLK